MGLKGRFSFFVFGYILSFHVNLVSFHWMLGNFMENGYIRITLIYALSTSFDMFTLQYFPLPSASHFMHFLITNANPISSLTNVVLAIYSHKAIKLPALTQKR